MLCSPMALRVFVTIIYEQCALAFEYFSSFLFVQLQLYEFVVLVAMLVTVIVVRVGSP